MTKSSAKRVMSGWWSRWVRYSFPTAGAGPLRPPTSRRHSATLRVEQLEARELLATATTTVLTLSPNPAPAFGQFTGTATVSPVPPATGVPTGTVTFLENSRSVGTGSLNNQGVASL